MKNNKGQTGVSCYLFKAPKNKDRSNAINLYKSLKKKQSEKWTSERQLEMLKITKEYNL
jgi:hypothetical protein